MCAENRDDGMGLGGHGMRERTSVLGGDFTLTSAPGEGTTIQIYVPLEVQEINGGES